VVLLAWNTLVITTFESIGCGIGGFDDTRERNGDSEEQGHAPLATSTVTHVDHDT